MESAAFSLALIALVVALAAFAAVIGLGLKEAPGADRRFAGLDESFEAMTDSVDGVHDRLAASLGALGGRVDSAEGRTRALADRIAALEAKAAQEVEAVWKHLNADLPSAAPDAVEARLDRLAAVVDGRIARVEAALSAPLLRPLTAPSSLGVARPPFEPTHAATAEPPREFLSERLVNDPGVSGSSPTVRGTVIPAETVVGHIVDGWAWREVINVYPELTADDIRACLAWKVGQQEGGPAEA